MVKQLMKINKILFVLVVFMVLVCVVSCQNNGQSDNSTNTTSTTTTTTIDSNSCPWANGGKLPEEYSLVEFEALSEVQQEMFFEWFASPEAFDAWLEVAQFEHTYGELSWNHGGKNPSEYTWIEYEELNDAQQEKFFEWFEDFKDFEKWMEIAQFENEYGDIPWNHGGKLPSEYTWEEFQSLSDAHKEMFFEWFETPEKFEEWMENAQ